MVLVVVPDEFPVLLLQRDRAVGRDGEGKGKGKGRRQHDVQGDYEQVNMNKSNKKENKDAGRTLSGIVTPS